MRDPFRPNSKSQLIREAQVGLTVVAILLSLFLYVAFYRITGRGRHLPEHVRNAPVAELVWPGASAVGEIEMTPQEYLESRRPRIVDANPSVPQSKMEVMPQVKRLERPVFGHVELKPPLKKKTIEIVQSPLNVKPKVKPLENSFDIARPPTSPKLLGNSSLRAAENQEVKQEVKQEVQLASLESTEPDNTSFGQLEIKSERPSLSGSKPSIQPDNSFQPTSESLENYAPSGMDSEDPSPTDFSSNSFEPSKESFYKRPLKPVESKLVQEQPAEAFAIEQETIQQEQAKQQSIEDKPNASDSRISSWDAELGIVEPGIAQPAIIPDLNSSDSSFGNSPISSDHVGSVETEDREQSLTYITREGDNFWSVAQKIYGDGRYFRALYKYNETTVPGFDSLMPGTRLGTPAKSDFVKLWPNLCPDEDSELVVGIDGPKSDAENRIYVTSEGDTLFEIARQKLGQASRYLEIKKMNDVRLDTGLNHLSPLSKGVRLVLPAQ